MSRSPCRVAACPTMRLGGVITADIAAEMKRHKAGLISHLKLKSSLDESQIRAVDPKNWTVC